MDAGSDDTGTFCAEEGGNLQLLECAKNPEHKNFIPVTDFRLQHIPEEYRDNEKFDNILTWSQLTVKIIVKYVSSDRPETYKDSTAKFPNYQFRGSSRKRSYGSGYIHSVTPEEDVDRSRLCSCFKCKDLETSQNQRWYFTIVTSIHIIFDSAEAQRAIIECFYDSDEKRSETVKYLYGVSTYPQTGRDNEKMSFVICVTHDADLAERLQILVKKRMEIVNTTSCASTGPAVLISHPHGCSKHISLGRVLYFTVPLGDVYSANQPILFGEDTECIVPYGSLSKVSLLELTNAHGIQATQLSRVSEPDEQQDCLSTQSLVENPSKDSGDTTYVTHCTDSQKLSSNSNNESPAFHTVDSNAFSNYESPKEACSELFSPDDNTDSIQPDGDDKNNNISLSSQLLQSDSEMDSMKRLVVVPDTSIDAGDQNQNENEDSFSVCFLDQSLENEIKESLPPLDHLVSLDLPPKMTYTLPDEAAFARRYKNLKALYELPPGTKFHLSDGTEVFFPPESLFYLNHRVSLQHGFMSYCADSCPGSSGGCMLLDGGSSFCNTLPHGGSLGGDVNLCAMRCYPIMPSAV